MQAMGRNPLYSTDLFLARQTGSEAAQAQAAAPEAVLAQYGVPLARLLAKREDRRGRVNDLAKLLVSEVSGFDFDEFRGAVSSMIGHEYLALVQRDPTAGDHEIELTKRGWMLAA